jgi:hypothetical protein
MASYDSSFNAQGTTVVGFETIDPPGPTVAPPGAPSRGFGVGVDGSQVGVHGEGMAAPLGTRAVSVSGIGVHGRGDFYGVYGVVGTILADNAPDIVGFMEPATPIGIFGVSDAGPAENPISSAPAVFGNNGVLAADLTASPELLNDMAVTIGQANVGVVGVSRSPVPKEGAAPLFLGGGGVVGVASINLAHAHEALVWATTNLTSNGVTGLNSGVTAVGAGPNPGLYAVTVGGRAGIFESRPTPQFVAAQVQLVPIQVEVDDKGNPKLPKLGQRGDLISIFTAEGGQVQPASLWFCIQSGSLTPAQSAQWAEISFQTVVTGDAP